MENKLQELTQKLYEEGLVKGRQEADALLADAEKKAGKIVEDARKEAENIISAARKESEDLARNTMSEIALAGKQAVATLKSRIGGMIIAKAASAPAAGIMMDAAFLKEMLLAVAKNWNGASADNVSLRAVLPAGMESKLDELFRSKVISELDGGIELAFSDKVKSGFKIGPKDGGYYISFTDADFDALLQEHLRGKVSQILYGEGK